MQLTRVISLCLSKLNSPPACYITLRVQRSTKPLILLFRFHFPESHSCAHVAKLMILWLHSVCVREQREATKGRKNETLLQSASRELCMCSYIYNIFILTEESAHANEKPRALSLLCVVYRSARKPAVGGSRRRIPPGLSLSHSHPPALATLDTLCARQRMQIPPGSTPSRCPSWALRRVKSPAHSHHTRKLRDSSAYRGCSHFKAAT
jgi:hypothetical protein